jgi:hypothetical protein
MRLHRLAALVSLATIVVATLASAPLAAAAGGRTASLAWTPSPTDTWQYQLQGRIDRTVMADVFDVDLFDVPRATIAALHAEGHHVVCYIDAGSWEPYRPDASRYPEWVIGKQVPGWPQERWLDIRRLSVLAPILSDRIARCARKGFDGVEFDWVDSNVQHTGFPISRADQLRFDRWLARTAHADGLAVGLKNALGLVPDLVTRYDFAVNEQCFQYHECNRERPFLDAGKAVFNVEYAIPRSAFCSLAEGDGISSIRKHLDLGSWRLACD